MAFKSLGEIRKAANTGHRGSKFSEHPLICYPLKTKRKGGTHSRRVVFRLRDAVLKEARLQPGDRVDVLWDDDNKMGCIKRLPTTDISGGFALCFDRGKSPDGGKTPGAFRTGTAVVQLAYLDDYKMPFPEAPVILTWTMSADGILFEFPKPADKPPTTAYVGVSVAGPPKHQLPPAKPR